MEHEVVLKFNDDEFEALSICHRYLWATSGGMISDLSWKDYERIYSLSYLIKSGLFSGVNIYGLFCEINKEKIAEMKEYLNRLEDK